MAQMGRPGLSSQQKEGRALGTVENRSVAKRYRSGSRQARSLCFWRAAVQGWHSADRQNSIAALVIPTGSGGNIARPGLGFVHAQNRRGAWAIAINDQPRNRSENHGRQKYRATDAEERAWQQALRPKPCLLAANKSLRIVVAKKLADHWSPQQVSGWLKVEYLDDRTIRVSETIYKSLFIQARGVLKRN